GGGAHPARAAGGEWLRLRPAVSPARSRQDNRRTGPGPEAPPQPSRASLAATAGTAGRLSARRALRPCGGSRLWHVAPCQDSEGRADADDLLAGRRGQPLPTAQPAAPMRRPRGADFVYPGAVHQPVLLPGGGPPLL